MDQMSPVAIPFSVFYQSSLPPATSDDLREALKVADLTKDKWPCALEPNSVQCFFVGFQVKLGRSSSKLVCYHASFLVLINACKRNIR